MLNASAIFARLLGREAKGLVPIKASFHRMASPTALKVPDVPAILFNTGYLSKPQHAAFLDSIEGHSKIAESISRAANVLVTRFQATP